MAGNVQPLDQKFPLVKPDGRPTDYFIRWAQQRQIDIGDGITLEGLQQFLADHALQAGSGISISPSGDISDSPTIAAEVQAILDQINDDWGSILFRGTTEWEALAPGPVGFFLKTNGAGADPEWAAGGGGGGNLLDEVIATGVENTLTISSIPSGYKSLRVEAIGRNTAASLGDIFYVRVNGDTGANYSGARQYMGAGTGTDGGNGATAWGLTPAFLFSLTGTTAPANNPSFFEMIIYDYDRTNFNKTMSFIARQAGDTVSATYYHIWGGGLWGSTSVINSITIGNSTAGIFFVAGTTFRIYGMA